MTNGMMTPESLSREASPGLPTGAHGIPEIQLQDVPTQQVALASHHMTEVKTHPGNSVNPAVLTASKFDLQIPAPKTAAYYVSPM